MENLKFSKDHEWVRAQDGAATVGISDFAQNALGDIVFVDLPKAGAKVAAGNVFATIESVKAVSEVYAPVSGTITAINGELDDAPELLNQAPYESWIAVIAMDDDAELDGLMDEAGYQEFCQEGA